MSDARIWALNYDCFYCIFGYVNDLITGSEILTKNPYKAATFL